MVDQYKQQLDGIMRREVNRGEFLKIVGVAVLGFVGVIGFFKNLHEIMPPQTVDKNRQAIGGYGRSAYGR